MSEVLAQALSAGGAAAVSSVALHPLDVIKTLLQASRSAAHDGNGSEAPRLLSAVDVARHILRTRGVAGFFAGLREGASESVVRNVVFFYCYVLLQRMVAGQRRMDTGTNLLVGMAAGVGGMLITSPLEVVATRARVDANGRGAARIARRIASKEGIAGFYRCVCAPLSGDALLLHCATPHVLCTSGLAANVVLCVNPAIQYTVFEQVKAMVLWIVGRRLGRRVRFLTAGQAFLVGAVAKAVATIVTYPYIRAKVIMQCSATEGAGAEQRPQRGMAGPWYVMKELVEEQGMEGLYRGLTPHLVKGVLSAAVMLMTKERIDALVRSAGLAAKQ